MYQEIRLIVCHEVIMDMDGLPIDDVARPEPRMIGMPTSAREVRDLPKLGCTRKPVTVNAKDLSVKGIAQSAAFSATTSSTGCKSVGELAMTPKISLVAVCCSSDSLSSWNRRTFSMAITAWSAKVVYELDLRR